MPPLLDRVRVLSVGHTLPAMYCIPALRDLGADITLIEPPHGQAAAARYTALSGLFPTTSLLAGTSRCMINLRLAAGRAVYLRMAEQADVILEGFRPGTSTRLDIDYDVVKVANPRLVYAAISGYGQRAPQRDRVGHDLNYLAASGVLHLTGPLDGPPAVPGVPFADGLAGVSAALNVVAALWRRQQTGEGCYLDLAIADGPAFLMAMEYDYFRQTGRERQRGDTHLSGGYPWYQVFETADGRYVSVAAVEPHFYARLCQVLGLPELADRQFADGAERQAIFDAFARIFKSKTADQWMQVLAGEDVCIAPVLSPAQAAAALEDAPSPCSPVRLPPAPPTNARDTAATLAGCGFTDDEIEALRRQAVIG